MARLDYINRCKMILYGQGLGEKPSMRQVAADAAETIAANTVAFSMIAGEGAKIKPGHVLSSVGATTTTTAYVLYVLSVATDVVTALRTYRGSPDAGASADLLDGLVLEQQPLRTEHDINVMVDTVFSSLLWDSTYFIDNTTSIAPDPLYGQVALAANVEDLVGAWQIIAGENVTIPFNVDRNLHTTVSANAVMGTFDQWDNSTIFLTFIRKLAIGDETADNALVEMVATGASALLLGASVSDTVQERSKKDSQNRSRDVASNLWRDFLALRQAHGRERGLDHNDEITVMHSRR